MRLSRNELQNMESLQLYWTEIHKNLHLVPVIQWSPAQVSKTHCTSSNGRRTAFHFICLYITLSQSYNYTFYFPWEGRDLPKHSIINFVGLLFANKNQTNGWVNRGSMSLSILHAGAYYHDYNFQVFIPTRISRSSSITGMFAPFDIPIWTMFLVTMVTSSLLFLIIQCPEKQERFKSLRKGNSWLLKTLLEQAAKPLKCRGNHRNGTNGEKSNNWLVAMGSWLLFGMLLINFYKGDMYSQFR